MGIEEYNLLKSTLDEVSNLHKKRSSNSRKYSELRQKSTLLEKELKESQPVSEMKVKVLHIAAEAVNKDMSLKSRLMSKGNEFVAVWLFLLIGFGMWGLYIILGPLGIEELNCFLCLGGVGFILMSLPAGNFFVDRRKAVLEEYETKVAEGGELARRAMRIEQLPGLIDDSEEMLRRITNENKIYDKSIEDKLASISHLIPYSDFLPEK